MNNNGARQNIADAEGHPGGVSSFGIETEDVYHQVIDGLAERQEADTYQEEVTGTDYVDLLFDHDETREGSGDESDAPPQEEQWSETKGAPAQPRGLTAKSTPPLVESPQKKRGIVLSWRGVPAQDNASAITYTIRRRTKGSSASSKWAPLYGAAALAGTEFIDINVFPYETKAGPVYEYQVSAVDKYGRRSRWSTAAECQFRGWRSRDLDAAKRAVEAEMDNPEYSGECLIRVCTVKVISALFRIRKKRVTDGGGAWDHADDFHIVAGTIVDTMEAVHERIIRDAHEAFGLSELESYLLGRRALHSFRHSDDRPPEDEAEIDKLKANLERCRPRALRASLVACANAGINVAGKYEGFIYATAKKKLIDVVAMENSPTTNRLNHDSKPEREAKRKSGKPEAFTFDIGRGFTDDTFRGISPLPVFKSEHDDWHEEKILASSSEGRKLLWGTSGFDKEAFQYCEGEGNHGRVGTRCMPDDFFYTPDEPIQAYEDLMTRIEGDAALAVPILKRDLPAWAWSLLSDLFWQGDERRTSRRIARVAKKRGVPGEVDRLRSEFHKASELAIQALAGVGSPASQSPRMTYQLVEALKLSQEEA